MKTAEVAQSIRSFLLDSEALKRELRHSYLTDGRIESVAEHVWQMSFLGIMVAPYLTCSFNQLKFLKLIIIHDLVEIYAGDMPITISSSSTEAKQDKERKEQQAIEKIKTKLPSTIGEEIYELWWEYEKNLTVEAKIAHALDKIEAQAQHNDAGIETWVEDEYHFAYKLKNYTMNETLLENLADILVTEVDTMLSSIEKTPPTEYIMS
ncbi:HD domain-containing protein [uncultured Shewanella sp.]|uniref:HD domain-containing protein n=1 Tax=uncultured Shewanella sp. TaxID=173975 RepID=UPI00260740B4|nr:HD domain-containing protein [uncultured Shewanella sp.]